MANVRVTMHHAAIVDFLHSPSQPIHQAVASRVRKVDAISAATAPVDKGRLKNSRTSGVRDEGFRLVGFVSFNVFYAIYNARGTGIYGPRGRKITAKKPGGQLVFRTKNGTLIRTKSVLGIPPNPWLVDALRAGAGGWPVNEH